MKPMKRKSDCPWTSTRKGKKQRKTTESTSEHKNTTLAQSDKGSWFDQVKWLKEEESTACVSARKLCCEIDSEDRTEKRNNIVVDINLLNGVIENGKPNGAKFKKQNCLHIQQIFYQGQERFQSTSPKSSHVQRIFFQGHGIF